MTKVKGHYRRVNGKKVWVKGHIRKHEMKFDGKTYILARGLEYTNKSSAKSKAEWFRKMGASARVVKATGESGYVKGKTIYRIYARRRK